MSGAGGPPPRAWATDLAFDRTAKALRITFEDGAVLSAPFELLRVESPSAEVHGHGGAKTLVLGKADVGVRDARPVGRYAVRIVFDDGHETGIYTWDYLRELAEQADARLSAYRARVAAL